MIQVIIFIIVWIVITPDTSSDATWVLMIAAVLAALNIWCWWPRLKADDKDLTPQKAPRVPKLK